MIDMPDMPDIPVVPHRKANLVLNDDRVKMVEARACTAMLCDWCDDEIKRESIYLTPSVPGAVLRQLEQRNGEKLARRYHSFCWDQARRLREVK